MRPPYLLLSDPPLDPTPDEARSRLRRELLRPEYNEQNLLQRFMRWVERQVGRGLEAAADAPPLSTLAAIQAPVIMMSQNRQSEKDRLAARLDYETNLRAEIDILALHAKLDTDVIDRLAALEAKIDALAQSSARA